MTNVLVAFATKGGTTQSIAERIGARLTAAGHQATVVPVQDNPDPRAYEAVIVGSGILANSVYSASGKWLTARKSHLVGRRVAVFVTCLSVMSEDGQEHESAIRFPDQLASVLPQPPVASTVFPGSYDPKSRTWWERVIMGLIRSPKGDFTDWDKVDAWAEDLAARFNS